MWRSTDAAIRAATAATKANALPTRVRLSPVWGKLPLLELLLLAVLAFAFALAEEFPSLPPFSPAPGWASAFQPAYRVNSVSVPSTAASKS